MLLNKSGADIDAKYKLERWVKSMQQSEVKNIRNRHNQSLKLTAQKGVQSRHKRINWLIYSGSRAALVEHSSCSTHPEHLFAAA